MPNDSKTYILDDQWTDKDTLDFIPYVETLADIIQTGNTPLTIGVFGTWGSGKTSLMRMVKKQLPTDFTVAWFDAWKYDKEETLWRAFILSVLTAVRSRVKEDQPIEDLDYLETMLYRAIEIEKTGGVTIDLAKLGGSVAKGVVQLGLSFIPGGAVLSEFVKKVQELGAESLTDEVTDAIQRERTKIHIEHVRFLEQFQSKFRVLVEQHISNNGGRLVVFVDDLDRCLPEKAIEVLEAIKLFLDVKDCVFVLGLDQGVIARGIEMKYREFGDKKDLDGQARFTIEGIKYLEKIIQLPFQIPPVEQNDMGDFVKGLSADWPDDECPIVFSVGLGDNPRQIKRTVNVFLMLWKLAERRKGKLEGLIKPIRLAKVVTIQAIFPELYSLIKDEPRYLGELEDYFRSLEFGGVINTEEGKEIVEVHKEPPPALASFVSKPAVERLLTMHLLDMPDANFVGLKSDELKLYFTLTRRAEAPQVSTFGIPLVISDPQMIKIPAGKFLMGSTSNQAEFIFRSGGNEKWLKREQPQHEKELPEYYIGKYPITNREYQVFVRDAKYKSPQGWDGDNFPPEKGDHPVVFVAWNDATAFCDWLEKKMDKPYRLPTEAEWEKAARSSDGRIWSGGNEIRKTDANTLETDLGDTSPVGQFSPIGDSPYGCADMIGNVWEWCSDQYYENIYRTHSPEENKDFQQPLNILRVLRGGSFKDFKGDARCAVRTKGSINFTNDVRGFRVALSSNSIEESN